MVLKKKKGKVKDSREQPATIRAINGLTSTTLSQLNTIKKGLFGTTSHPVIRQQASGMEVKGMEWASSGIDINH